MRRSPSRRKNDQADVDMTPMLDIVFILLIFFIVTATFLQEQGIDITPPPPSDNENTPQNPVIFVQIDENNSVFVNQVATSEQRVLAAVSRLRAEQPNSAVLIEVDDEAEHGTLIFLMDEMRANSIAVSYNRREPSE